MEMESVVQLVPFLVWILIAVIPSVRLLRRTGIHVALAAFNIVPFIGTLILLWIVAYSKWPAIVGPAPHAAQSLGRQ
jgi:hypothetical protein